MLHLILGSKLFSIMASPTNQRRSSRLNKSSSLDESSEPILTPSPLARKSRLQSKGSPSPTRYHSQGRQTSPNKQEWISENDTDSNPSDDDEGHPTQEILVRPTQHTPETKIVKRSPVAASSITKESAIPSGGQPKTKSSSLFPTALLIVALIALMVSLLLVACSKVEKSDPSTLPDQQEELLEIKLVNEIKTMQRLFPLQSNETWANFYAAFRGIMEEEPPQPSVLLLIGPNSSEGIETVQCLAERMARITNHIFGSLMTSSVTIHLEDIRKKKDEALKSELDDRLRLVLQGSHAVVLKHLEQIPPKAAMILHGFCDNFAAPFKKKIIILTATFNQENHPVDSRQVDRQLHVLWDGELGADKSASLVSRVANSPLFIEPESGPATRCNLT